MASFYFKAVAADGKQRTGTLTGDTEKAVAGELRRQGLVPVYVGAEPKRSSFSVRLPALVLGKRRDVLFFTQELATLLKAGVPLDRGLVDHRRAYRKTEPSASITMDVLRALKGGKSLADSLGTHPEYFSELYVNMVRAGEASGALAAVFDRLSEFETSRDELRGYIISSMIYPALLSSGGSRLGSGAVDLRGAAIRGGLRAIPHGDPTAHATHAHGQPVDAVLRLDTRRGRGGVRGRAARLHPDG